MPQACELAAQIGDFLFDFGLAWPQKGGQAQFAHRASQNEPVPGGVGGSRLGQFGQIDAVVFAEAIDQSGSLVLELTGGEFAFVEFFFQFADPISPALGFVDGRGPFGANRFAAIDVADRFAAEGFFLQIQLRQLRLGRQDLGLGFVDAFDRSSQLLAAVGQGRVGVPRGLARIAAIGFADDRVAVRRGPIRLSPRSSRDCEAHGFRRVPRCGARFHGCGVRPVRAAASRCSAMLAMKSAPPPSRTCGVRRRLRRRSVPHGDRRTEIAGRLPLPDASGFRPIAPTLVDAAPSRRSNSRSCRAACCSKRRHQRFELRDVSLELDDLMFQRAKLAAARDQSGRRLQRADRSAAVGIEELATDGDELQAAAGRRLGSSQSPWQNLRRSRCGSRDGESADHIRTRRGQIGRPGR